MAAARRKRAERAKSPSPIGLDAVEREGLGNTYSLADAFRGRNAVTRLVRMRSGLARPGRLAAGPITKFGVGAALGASRFATHPRLIAFFQIFQAYADIAIAFRTAGVCNA